MLQGTGWPSSASHNPNDHISYGGSRRLVNRFRYANRASKAGFVELAPTARMTIDQLYHLLGFCTQYVESVQWQTNKTSQGNIGGHRSERNIKVFPLQPGVPQSRKRFLEFAITRHDHMSNIAPCRETHTVMFKDPPDDLVIPAWKILRWVCSGYELYPRKSRRMDE